MAKKKKRKLSKRKIIIFLVVVAFIIKLFNTNITNIYVSGNTYLTDQEIIDISGISDYPNSLSNMFFKIEDRLEESINISKANVKKNIFLNKVYIVVKENYPLFYYSTSNKTVLYNGEEIDDKQSNLTIINSIPNKIYKNLINKIKSIDINILNRISEIEYKPNEIYEDRLLLLMNDGNYVYITVDKFLTLNKYLDIVKYINSDEKGVIRLDSGKYFESFDY